MGRVLPLALLVVPVVDRDPVPELCATLASVDRVVVAEDHRTDAGPNVLAGVLDLAASCGMPMDCAFFEVPADVDLARCGPRCAVPSARHALFPEVTEALARDHVVAVPVDYPARRLDALFSRYDGSTEDELPAATRELIRGRNRYMADRVADPSCGTGVELVGHAHVLVGGPTGEVGRTLLAGELAIRGHRVLVLRSRCGFTDQLAVTLDPGGRSGTAEVPCAVPFEVGRVAEPAFRGVGGQPGRPYER